MNKEGGPERKGMVLSSIRADDVDCLTPLLHHFGLFAPSVALLQGGLQPTQRPCYCLLLLRLGCTNQHTHTREM